MNVGESSKPKDKNLTGPDIVKKIVQIILLNRDKDKRSYRKIKNILLEWDEQSMKNPINTWLLKYVQQLIRKSTCIGKSISYTFTF